MADHDATDMDMDGWEDGTIDALITTDVATAEAAATAAAGAAEPSSPSLSVRMAAHGAHTHMAVDEHILAGWTLADAEDLSAANDLPQIRRRKRRSHAAEPEAPGSAAAAAASSDAAAVTSAAAAAAAPSGKVARSHKFGAGNRKRTATAAAAAMMASKSGKISAAAAAAAASAFPPPGTRAYGTVPFAWYNTLDGSSPLNFLYIERNVLHPSASANLARAAAAREREGAAAANWGCDCPNGACQPATCPCAQHGRNQYRRNGGMQTDTQPQSYVECWDLCSCACSPQSAAAQSSQLSASMVGAEWQQEGERDATASPTSSPDECPAAPASYPVIIGEQVVSLAGPVPRIIRTLSDMSSPDVAASASRVHAMSHTTAAESTAATVAPHAAGRVDATVAAAAEYQLAAASTSPCASSSSNGALTAGATPSPPARSSRSALPTCFNRVVQRSPVNPSIRLVVFKTGEKGWALRTLSRIPKYSYVCEYVGEVVHEHVSELRGAQLAKQKRSNYLFTPIIAPRTDATPGTSGGGGDRDHPPGEHHYDVDTECFSIDSSVQGHLSRFINHSCSPNLISSCVYVEAHRGESRLPRVALFAARTIEPGTELCMHYGIDNDIMQREFLCRCSWCKSRETVAMQTAALAEAMQAAGSKGNQKKQKRSHHSASPPVPVLDAKVDAISAQHQQQLVVFDALSPVPLPPSLMLDASIPLPTAAELADPASVFFGSRRPDGPRGGGGGALDHECVAGRGRKVLLFAEALSAHARYQSHLRNLVGARKCIPTGDSCCLAHVHPSRVSLACFALQCAWQGSVAWHEAQLELMRRAEEEKAEAAAAAAAAAPVPVVKKEEPGVKAESKPNPASSSPDPGALPEEKDLPLPFERTYWCGLCDRYFATRLQLCAHRTEHVPLHRCDRCGMLFHSTHRLAIHQAHGSVGRATEHAEAPASSVREGNPHATRTRQRAAPHEVGPLLNPPLDSLIPRSRRSQTSTSATAATTSSPAKPGPASPERPAGPPRPPPKVTHLHFKGVPVRIIDWPLSSDPAAANTPTAAAASASSPPGTLVSSPTLSVFSTDLCEKLLGLTPHVKNTFLRTLSPALQVRVPTSAVLRTQSKKGYSATTSVCLTLAGVQHTLATYAQELLRRPGLKLFAERALLPVLGGLAPQLMPASPGRGAFSDLVTVKTEGAIAHRARKVAPTRTRQLVNLDSDDSPETACVPRADGSAAATAREVGPQWASEEQGDEDSEVDTPVEHTHPHSAAAAAAASALARMPGGRSAPVNLVSPSPPPPPANGATCASAACTPDVVMVAMHTRSPAAHGTNKREQKQQINPLAFKHASATHASPPPPVASARSIAQSSTSAAATGPAGRAVPVSSLSLLSSPPPLRVPVVSGSARPISMPSSTPSSPVYSEAHERADAGDDDEAEVEGEEEEHAQGQEETQDEPEAEQAQAHESEFEEPEEEPEEPDGLRDHDDPEWCQPETACGDQDEEGDEDEEYGDSGGEDNGVVRSRRAGTHGHTRSSVGSNDGAYSGHHPGRMARSDRVLRHPSNYVAPPSPAPRAPCVNTSSRRSTAAAAGSSSRVRKHRRKLRD